MDQFLTGPPGQNFNVNAPPPMSFPPAVLGVASLAQLVRERRERVLWVGESGAVTWGEFGMLVEDCRQRAHAAGVSWGSLVVTPGAGAIKALAWMFGIAAAGGIVLPLRDERRGEIDAWKQFIAVEWSVDGSELIRHGRGRWSDRAAALVEALKERGHPGLVLATGGTTGIPKVMLHDLVSLWSTVPLRPTDSPRRILPLMKLDHIGGLDALWRALAAGHIVVDSPAPFSVANVADVIFRHRVEVLPATPSFLNLLLLGNVVRTHDLSSLRTVPYGAELMSPALLARLRRALPEVEFVERFGTSETGALPVIATENGLELRTGANQFEWSIRDGELWIRSPARALGYLAGDSGSFEALGWFRSGDLAVRNEDGSIRVVGRRTELINVGGEKVLPSVVESALLEHPRVADCRVSGRMNAVLGQVVTADLVWTGPETDPLVVKRILHDFVVAVLPKSHLPVAVRLCHSIDSTDNLKKSRRSC